MMTMTAREMVALKQNLVGGAIDFLRNGITDKRFTESNDFKKLQKKSEIETMATVLAICENEDEWDEFWYWFGDICRKNFHD